MESGSLRNRIIFVEKIETRDSFGSVLEDWETGPRFEVQAAYENIGSREFPSFQKRFAETTCRFRVRYDSRINRPNASDVLRIRFILDRDADTLNYQDYNITPPVDPEGKRRELLIEASEIK